MDSAEDIGIEQFIAMLEAANNSQRKTLNDFLNGSSQNANGSLPAIDAEEAIIGRSLVLTVLYGILIAVALFGNVLVCHVIFSRRRMRTVTNIFIANLAVSDLIIIVLNVPFNIAKTLMNEWLFGNAMCVITNMSLIASVYASTFTLTVISLDRQRVLLYPLRPRILKSGGLIMVAVIWIVSIILSLPFGIFSGTREVDLLYAKKLRCSSLYPSELFEQLLTVFTIVIQYVVPLAVISVTYGRIVRRIWERSDLGAVTANQHASRSKNKKKSIKMLLIVVIVFAICWMPLNLYHILTDLHPDTETFHYNATAFFVCHWIAISSTCYNPFIYCWLNEAFRAEIRAVFRCCCPMEVGIYPRDHHANDKMDTVSQSDSMSMHIKPKGIFLQREPTYLTQTKFASLSQAKSSRKNQVCSRNCPNGPCYCMAHRKWNSENPECEGLMAAPRVSGNISSFNE
ncbi:G-protein coupled receptor 83-like [Mya arenaria]|uniref:G-protein coupled receptor 83-like n=1 Tax=Mya arenaria TaxID=6604 RepID=UPI0022E87F2C|nr:G-protein coupled receptor 83-like [Mya arenaria]